MLDGAGMSNTAGGLKGKTPYSLSSLVNASAINRFFSLRYP